MRTLAERRQVLRSICELAKRGHEDAIKFLHDYGRCKVYTYEEIKQLNAKGVNDFSVENLLGGVNNEREENNLCTIEESQEDSLAQESNQSNSDEQATEK